jgi:hypothetical protein
MSFVTAIRDYVEILNHLSDSWSGHEHSLVQGVNISPEQASLQLVPITEIVVKTLKYLFTTSQSTFIYILSFQWLRDFTLLPIIIPQISSAIFRETFFLESPANMFFFFFEIPSLRENTLLLGIFNSIFLTLPLSVIHILTIRRLFIKGIPAATFSIVGYLVGQWLFIGSVIFGLRNVLIPWLTFEPLSYLLGIIIIFRLVYSMTQENLRELPGWNQPQYINFFLTSFVLSWCEQTAVFQYLGNLSLAPTPSTLETLSSSHNFFGHFFYIIGIAIGSLFFTFFWGIILIQLKNWCIRYTPLFLSSFIQTINTGSFVLAIGLSLSSVPFYGLDYLTTGPFGFVSQDKVFKNTVFDQYNVKDSVMGLGISSQFDSVDIDISPFDRGRYLVFPERTMPFAFEDLNYRGEFEWTTRYDKVSTVTDSRAGFLSLAKLFKKQKTDELGKVPQARDESQNSLSIKSQFASDTTSLISGIENNNSRFQEWYALDSTNSADDARPLESIFSEMQDTTFPLDFLRTASVEPGNIDLKIKQKYYSNPLYKNLLTLDIDLFLNRQPKTSRLNGEHELDLYTKRRMLTTYYDSLRDYAQLPYAADFAAFFEGSKSFSNKVYNQQFKGTLRSVCRLFSLTSDRDALLNREQGNQLVLKCDQPLYTFPNDPNFSSYHEELSSRTKSEQKVSPFLANFVSGPLYAGWDEKLRKLIITNKFLPRTSAGYQVTIPQNVRNQFTNEKLKISEKSKIKFTVWPLSKKVLEQGKNQASTISYSTLYAPQSEFEAPGDPRFDTLSTLPANWETRNRRINIGLGKTYENIFDYLAPQRGGFVWPGTNKPNLKFSPSPMGK